MTTSRKIVVHILAQRIGFSFALLIPIQQEDVIKKAIENASTQT